MRGNSDIWTYENEKQMVSTTLSLRNFANQYPNKQIGEQILKNMVNKYPKYRAIRGDGNCFYRAIAFLYLRQTDLSSFSRLFKDIPMICTNYPIQIQSQQQFKNTLLQAYKKFIQPLASARNKAEKEVRIQNLFNQYWAFDALMIAYFRSLNYRQVDQNRQKYNRFYENKDVQLRKIATFYQQSQGVELHSMADALNAKITIIIAYQMNIQNLQYGAGSQSDNFKLFFRPGHYDIVYSQNQVVSERKTEVSNIQKKFANQYQVVNERKIEVSNIQKKFTNQYQRIYQGDQSQRQNRNDQNVNSNIKSTKDPRVKSNRNQFNPQYSANKSGQRRQSSSIRYQGNGPIDMTGSAKHQNLKYFTASQSKRNKNFDYYSDGSLRVNQNIQQISVKNHIVQSQVNVWRIFVESTATEYQCDDMLNNLNFENQQLVINI